MLKGTTITWLGHSTFLCTTAAGKKILIDPWLAGNPKCPEAFHDLAPDAILITHGHGDHIGDVFSAAARCTGPIVGMFDLTTYVAGDTCVFGDMALIKELYSPDLAILPIGDRFTMDPRGAAVACRLLGVKAVLPCHWSTFGLLTGTPSELRRELAALSLSVGVLDCEPGGSIS